MTAAPLVAALLLGAAGSPGPSRPSGGQVAAGQRVEVVVRFPPWQFTGTFTLTGAGLADHGAAEDLGALTGGAGEVLRTLRGERGTITLRLRGEVYPGSFPAVLGRWQVSQATGAYAGLTGGGSFTATDLGTGKGSPLELQTLLGRVTPPRHPAAWRDLRGPPATPLRPVGPTPER